MASQSDECLHALPHAAPKSGHVRAHSCKYVLRRWNVIIKCMCSFAVVQWICALHWFVSDAPNSSKSTCYQQTQWKQDGWMEKDRAVSWIEDAVITCSQQLWLYPSVLQHLELHTRTHTRTSGLDILVIVRWNEQVSSSALVLFPGWEQQCSVDPFRQRSTIPPHQKVLYSHSQLKTTRCSQRLTVQKKEEKSGSVARH